MVLPLESTADEDAHQGSPVDLASGGPLLPGYAAESEVLMALYVEQEPVNSWAGSEWLGQRVFRPEYHSYPIYTAICRIQSRS